MIYATRFSSDIILATWELFYVKQRIEKDNKLSVNLPDVYMPSNPSSRLIDLVSGQQFLFSTPSTNWAIATRQLTKKSRTEVSTRPSKILKLISPRTILCFSGLGLARIPKRKVSEWNDCRYQRLSWIGLRPSKHSVLDIFNNLHRVIIQLQLHKITDVYDWLWWKIENFTIFYPSTGRPP